MHQCILSNTLHVGQEGGPGSTCRRTHWQPWNLINTIEKDAYLGKQGVYCIYTDSMSGYEMFNCAKLLRLMYDQGMPTDAMVVKGIYKDSRTAVARPFGTNPLLILVTRGTIQCDPLSPLL